MSKSNTAVAIKRSRRSKFSGGYLSGGGATPTIPTRVTDIPVPSPEFNCTLLDTQTASCLYPHGHPQDADFRYCGFPKVYRNLCAYHAALCYEKLDRNKLVAVSP